jgi:hypothetical protein
MATEAAEDRVDGWKRLTTDVLHVSELALSFWGRKERDSSRMGEQTTFDHDGGGRLGGKGQRFRKQDVEKVWQGICYHLQNPIHLEDNVKWNVTIW